MKPLTWLADKFLPKPRRTNPATPQAVITEQHADELRQTIDRLEGSLETDPNRRRTRMELEQLRRRDQALQADIVEKLMGEEAFEHAAEALHGALDRYPDDARLQQLLVALTRAREAYITERVSAEAEEGRA